MLVRFLREMTAPNFVSEISQLIIAINLRIWTDRKPFSRSAKTHMNVAVASRVSSLHTSPENRLSPITSEYKPVQLFEKNNLEERKQQASTIYIDEQKVKELQNLSFEN